MFDPSDPYNSISEWAQEALAKKRATGQLRRLQSAGIQPSGLEFSTGQRRGSKENPYAWYEWEKAGDNDLVYERPEEQDIPFNLMTGSKAQRWRGADRFRKDTKDRLELQGPILLSAQSELPIGSTVTGEYLSSPRGSALLRSLRRPGVAL